MKSKIFIPFFVFTCLLPMLAKAQQLYYSFDTTSHIAGVLHGSLFSNCPDINNGIVVIPSNFYGGSGHPYNGYPITYIGVEAFKDCPNMTNVTVGTNVTDIYDRAFAGCYNMKSLDLGSSVINLGAGAFYGCVVLTYVPIPLSVKNIGTRAFFGCIGLTGLVGLSGVTNIEDLAFANCAGLTGITIPDSVTHIGPNAFNGCTSLAIANNAALNNSLTRLEFGVFSGCTSLVDVGIPNSVTSIGGSAFSGCTSLTNITIPNNVTNIEDYAFANCTSLANITVQGNAPDIGINSHVFENVSGGAKVYYYYGTTGWGSTYGGLPTVMLGAPAPQIVGSSAGLLSSEFSFAVTGITNQTIVVEASTNLAAWQPIWTNTSSNASVNFADSQWTNYPARFYRAVAK